MLDECNANQITLARARRFGIYLFIISVRSGTYAVHHSDFCLLFPLSTGPLLPENLASASWQLVSASRSVALASHSVASAATAHGLV